MEIRLGVGAYEELIRQDIDFYLANFEVLELQDFIMPGCLDNPLVVKRYRDMLDGWPGEITVHGPYLHLVPTSLDARVKQVAEYRYLQAVEAAQSLGASKVVIHSYYDLHTGYADYDAMWLDDNLHFWNAFLERVEGSGVKVLLENLHDPDPATFARLISRINRPYFGSCIDFGHSHCFSPFQPDQWARLVPGSYFHISDNDGSCDSHSLIGQGAIDFARISEELDLSAGLCLVSESRAPIVHQIEALRMLQALIVHHQKR